MDDRTTLGSQTSLCTQSSFVESRPSSSEDITEDEDTEPEYTDDDDFENSEIEKKKRRVFVTEHDEDDVNVSGGTTPDIDSGTPIINEEI